MNPISRFLTSALLWSCIEHSVRHATRLIVELTTRIVSCIAELHDAYLCRLVVLTNLSVRQQYISAHVILDLQTVAAMREWLPCLRRGTYWVRPLRSRGNS